MSQTSKFVVRLTAAERQFLECLTTRQKKPVAAAKGLRARLLLQAGEGSEGPAWTDERIGRRFGVSLSTMHRLRQRLVEEGLEAALARQARAYRPPPQLDGAGEARLVALACSTPPADQARWTLRLLGDKLVELKVVDSISEETVRQRLKKTTSSPGAIASG